MIIEISHCDMKSRNVLVKDDSSLCICDLGIAVKGSSNGEVDKIPNNRLYGKYIVYTYSQVRYIYCH